MAQLKQDEWPADGEETTQESTAIRRDEAEAHVQLPPRIPTPEEVNREAEESIINNVDPHEATD